MADGNVGLSGVVGGISFAGSFTPAGPGRAGDSVTLAAGKAGTLSTRTDNNTGIVTSASHGLTDATTVGVYWSGGSRRGMTVTAYDANTISIDVGVGDNLPSASTAVVIAPETTLSLSFVGDDAQLAVVQASVRGNFEFRQSDETPIQGGDLNAGGSADEFWAWRKFTTGGTTNPFAGVTCSKVLVSNGSSSASCIVKVAIARSN